MSTARLEAWLWAGFDSVRTVRLSEDNVTWWDLTLADHMTVTDALAEWKTQADAAGALTYTFSYNDDMESPAITVRATGSFYIEFADSLHVALGFASGVLGPATTFTSTTIPAAICTPIAIDYQAPQEAADISADRFRFGRTASHVFIHGRVVSLDYIAVYRAVGKVLDQYGALLQGRVRAWCDTSAGGAYAEDRLNGYFDLCPFETRKVSAVGNGELLLEFSMRGSL